VAAVEEGPHRFERLAGGHAVLACSSIVPQKPQEFMRCTA